MSRSVTHHPGALQTSTRLAAVARTGQHPPVPDAEPLPLTVAGRRLEAAELRGDAHRRPFVLLHEGLGSVALWRGFPQALHAATGRRVIAFSRFGHGRSEPPPIALIHAARRPVPGIALLAPHVIVEDVTVAAIREAREAYDRGDLRERMGRHHDDPDAAFNGWCDVWLDPGFRDWSLESEAERVTCPVLLIQGAEDPYGTLDQLDRIEAKVRGPVERLVVPGGHSPHLEATRAVVDALVRWAGDR
jgi:pimeloyl-ACP methyl ester carboxylesterase